MSKPFLEVFAGLKLPTQVGRQFEDVEVLKITSTSKKDFLRIYISSEHLISKEIVYKAENEIKNQLFKNNDLTVKMYERFHLSSQYTPQNLMDAYWESILLEFQQYDHIMYIALRGAEITYPDSAKILLTVEESVLTKSKEEEMLRILNKVFQERCGVDVVIKFDYREPVESKFAEEEEKKLSMEVAEIAARLRALNGRDDDGSGQPGAVQTVTADGQNANDSNGQNGAKAGGAQAGQAAGKGGSAAAKAGDGRGSVSAGAGNRNAGGKGFPQKGGFKGKGDRFYGGDGKKGIKRSDNPDVVYGRDFDKEVTKIVDIIGEIGEVTIWKSGSLRTTKNPF